MDSWRCHALPQQLEVFPVIHRKITICDACSNVSPTKKLVDSICWGLPLYAFHCFSFIFQIINHDFLWHPPCFPYPKDPSTSNVPARWICHSDHISLVTKLRRTRQKWIEIMIFSCVFMKLSQMACWKEGTHISNLTISQRNFLFVIVKIREWTINTP